MTSVDRLVVEHLAVDSLEASDAALVYHEIATAALDQLAAQHVEIRRLLRRLHEIDAERRTTAAELGQVRRRLADLLVQEAAA